MRERERFLKLMFISGSKMGKQVKGLVSRLDELETELEGERVNRGKAEKTRWGK